MAAPRRQQHSSGPSRSAQTRSLSALERSASTSRVLNLLSVANANHGRPEYMEAPFFSNRVLNSAIIVKHRLRTDDLFLFNDFRATATKVIIPFERSDLNLGGRSFFIGQRGWTELLYEACNNPPELARDVEVPLPGFA